MNSKGNGKKIFHELESIKKKEESTLRTIKNPSLFYQNLVALSIISSPHSDPNIDSL